MTGLVDDGGSRSPPLLHVPAAGGRSLLGGRMLLKVGAAESSDTYTLCLGQTPPGLGPPLHLHELDDQTHYVLSGTYELQCGPDLVTAGPGALVHMPRYTPHTFRNVGDRPAEIIELTTPGGIDRYFDAVAHLGPFATDIEARNEVGRPYGISFPTDPSAFVEPPDGGDRRPITIVPAGEGRRVDLSGHEAVRKLSAGDTGGLHTLTEVVLPARATLASPRPDRLLFVVLEGKLGVASNGDIVEARRGDTVAMLSPGEATAATGEDAGRFLLYSFPAAT